MRCFDRPVQLNGGVDTSEEGVVIETAGKVLRVDCIDRFRHVQDLGLPVVLPARFSPEQTLVSDSEHHLK